MKKIIALLFAVLLASCGEAPVQVSSITQPSHSWGDYHWARTEVPTILPVMTSIAPYWDAHIAVTTSAWTFSALSFSPEPGEPLGRNKRKCTKLSGVVHVCSAEYGRNNWLGLASITIDNNSHITSAVVKLNDSYLTSPPYDFPELKQHVACHELGHTIGLDHNDEIFDNEPTGTCMDYSNHIAEDLGPNEHDFEVLEEVYSHIDPYTTIGITEEPEQTGCKGRNPKCNGNLGQLVRSNKQEEMWIKDLPDNKSLRTYILLVQ